MGIHGDKSQNDRDYVLNQFRNNNIDILVATDVAARGLGNYFSWLDEPTSSVLFLKHGLVYIFFYSFPHYSFFEVLKIYRKVSVELMVDQFGASFLVFKILHFLRQPTISSSSSSLVQTPVKNHVTVT